MRSSRLSEEGLGLGWSDTAGQMKAVHLKYILSRFLSCVEDDEKWDINGLTPQLESSIKSLVNTV